MLKEVNLNAFSIDGYCLPTFQKATLRTKGFWFWKKKYLTFQHYPDFDVLKGLKEETIQVI